MRPNPARLRGMRRSVVTLLTGLALFAISLGAHASHPGDSGDALDHLDLVVKDIEPGGTERIPIESVNHGPLRKGWVYIMHSHVEGNTSLQVSFGPNSEEVDRFTWNPGSNTYYTKIGETARHEVAVTNPGDETVRFGFYYDQSCNCEGKMIPLPGGVVMFNYPLPVGWAKLAYPIPFDWHVKGTLATHDETLPTADWPDDFQTLQESDAKGPGEGASGPNWLNFSFSNDRARMIYVHIEAIEGGDPDHPILLSATIEVDEPENAPIGAPLLVIAAVTIAVGHRVRPRRTNA